MLFSLKKFIFILTFYVTHVYTVKAQDTIKVAALEMPPFMSSELPQQGYAIEVIKEAFASKNYSVDIEFVNLARGFKLLEKGLISGLITPYGKQIDPTKYLLSSPFPGDSIGFLTLKSFQIPTHRSSPNSFKNNIKQFSQYRVGLIKGSNITHRFSAASLSKIKFAISDIENIDKLENNTVDLIVTGKYTAAEIITNKRPHLIGKLVFIESSDSIGAFHIAFSQRNPNYRTLQKNFNDALATLQEQGTLAKIREKHGFYQEQVKSSPVTKITIGTVNNKDMLRLQALSNAFENIHPDIEIDWRVMNENTLRKRLLSDLAISAGEFDIITIGLQEMASWSKNKWLSPISHLPNNYDLPDLFESLRDSLSYQGQLSALPFYAESSVTYYRKDLFLQAGLNISQAPTYDEILQYAKAIHNPQKNIYGICLRGKAGWGENVALFTTMVNTYGGRWFDQNWNPKLNTNAWKNALHTYKKLLNQYGPPKPEYNGYSENLQLFLEGKCGIWVDATVAASTLFDKSISRVSNKVSIVKAPVAITKSGANWLWAWSLAIPMSSKHKAAANKFIAWATSKEYVELVANTYSWKDVPQGVRRSTHENKKYLKVAPYSQIILESIVEANGHNKTLNNKPYSGIQFVEISEFPALGNYLGKILSEVIQGKITVDNALKKAQNHTKMQMSVSGYYH